MVVTSAKYFSQRIRIEQACTVNSWRKVDFSPNASGRPPKMRSKFTYKFPYASGGVNGVDTNHDQKVNGLRCNDDQGGCGANWHRK